MSEIKNIIVVFYKRFAIYIYQSIFKNVSIFLCHNYLNTFSIIDTHVFITFSQIMRICVDHP